MFNSWSTCAKLTWDVPRSTHTYLVDNLLAAQFYTVKKQLVGRYLNFAKKLLKRSSPELCVVANMVARFTRSTMGKDMSNI